jgi:hypothetical protein
MDEAGLEAPPSQGLTRRLYYSRSSLPSPPRAQIPALQDMLQEARHDRLYPGEGELWLGDILDAMPPGVPNSRCALALGRDLALTARDRWYEAVDSTTTSPMTR